MPPPSLRSFHTQKNNDSYLVRLSYLQIYNEVISDLLKPERTNLAIREDRRRGVFVDGLSEWVVRSPREVHELMARGAEQVRPQTAVFFGLCFFGLCCCSDCVWDCSCLVCSFFGGAAGVAGCWCCGAAAWTTAIGGAASGPAVQNHDGLNNTLQRRQCTDNTTTTQHQRQRLQQNSARRARPR